VCTKRPCGQHLKDAVVVLRGHPTAAGLHLKKRRRLSHKRGPPQPCCNRLHEATRGYSTEAVTDTILRRMHDYVEYICPQFSRTHINFQRVPVVDTSNPFIARYIPAPDESMLVIQFANPRGIDFPYLLSMLHDSFMSRPNTIVCPGGKMDLAMQLIFTPMIWRLIERRKQAMAQ
jgi:phosphoribulokinase